MRNERFFTERGDFGPGPRQRWMAAPVLGRGSSGPVAMAATVARAGGVAVMYVWRC